jgi:hypothetical protein
MSMLADEHVLVAYVDGNDFHEVAPILRSHFQDFIAKRQWCTDQVTFVDQVHDPDPAFPDWLPDWDLGINLGLDHVPQMGEWFVDIETLVQFMEGLHAESGRDFVLFLAYRSRPWLQEHLYFINGEEVDLHWLREAIERITGSGA